jgi:dTDP-4-amino-4,6-dideoxygalactose transaminase
MQPIYAGCGFVTRDGQDVGADIFQRGLCLPSDIKMTAQEQDKIIQIIRSCFA